MQTPVPSHPARGAWIEILFAANYELRHVGRTPHGVRGLKCGGQSAIVIDG